MDINSAFSNSSYDGNLKQKQINCAFLQLAHCKCDMMYMQELNVEQLGQKENKIKLVVDASSKFLAHFDSKITCESAPGLIQSRHQLYPGGHCGTPAGGGAAALFCICLLLLLYWFHGHLGENQHTQHTTSRTTTTKPRTPDMIPATSPALKKERNVRKAKLI